MSLINAIMQDYICDEGTMPRYISDDCIKLTEYNSLSVILLYNNWIIDKTPVDKITNNSSLFYFTIKCDLCKNTLLQEICVIGTLNFHSACAKICVNVLSKLLCETIVDDHSTKIILTDRFNTKELFIYDIVQFTCNYISCTCVISYNNEYIKCHQMQLNMIRDISDRFNIYDALSKINCTKQINNDTKRCASCPVQLEPLCYNIYHAWYCD